MTSGQTETVLITGANGFIGGFLADEALLRGLQVVCLVRKTSDCTDLEKKGIILVRTDYTQVNELAEILTKYQVQYIIHNAGMTKARTEEEYMQANVTVLERLANASILAKITLKKFILVSSLAAYGPADFQKEGIVRNSSVPHPVTAYGRSKLAGEVWLKKQAAVPWVIIRPSIVYGPGEKDLYSVFRLVANHLDLKPGMVAPKLTFIYVKDLARCILDAMVHAPAASAYFVTDGNVYNGDALTGFIKETLSTWTISFRIPVFVLTGAAVFNEWWSNKKGVVPILNQDKINEIKARSWVCDVAPLYEIGFKAEYNLAKGVRETVGWYKKQKWL
jgi:nucleoside-diphosphate-sugar epimerase